jgi:hypothetical protein
VVPHVQGPLTQDKTNEEPPPLHVGTVMSLPMACLRSRDILVVTVWERSDTGIQE